MKLLRCRDAGFDCPHEIRAQTGEGILKQAAEHLQRVHNLETTPALVEQVKGLIQDLEESQSG